MSRKEQTKPVEKLGKEEAYIIEILNAEREYRMETSAGYCKTPFVTEQMVRIHGTLRLILYFQAASLGLFGTLLALILAKV